MVSVVTMRAQEIGLQAASSRRSVRVGCDCRLGSLARSLDILVRGIEGGKNVKRFALAVIAIAVLALAAGSALAATPTIDVFPVEFTLSSDTCPNLASGTTIVGTGSETSITSVSTDKTGVTTVMNTSHAHGTATDQAGNTYVFNYANHFRVSDTGPGTGFSGEMVDAFSLAGNGPARLSNGFRAVFTFLTLEELTSRGDPLDFSTQQAKCDPL
jgi:hypothetical protein